MSKGVGATIAAAIAAEQVASATAIELDFPDGFVRFCTALRDITINGVTFSGIGMLGGVSITEDSAELRSNGQTVELSGIPRDLVVVALQQRYQGRRGSIYEVILHPDTHAVLGAVIIFRGRMDTMQIELGDTATVRVSLENRLADWERPRLRRYTDADQQRAHAGDTGFRFVPSVSEQEIVWPGRAYFEQGGRRR